jgi:hypothetical protein
MQPSATINRFNPKCDTPEPACCDEELYEEPVKKKVVKPKPLKIKKGGKSNLDLQVIKKPQSGQGRRPVIRRLGVGKENLQI